LSLIKVLEPLSPIFLNQYIKTSFFQRELWKRTIHVAFPKKINLGEIGECVILFPQKPEQEKIASFLSSVDDWLENLKKQKEEWEKYKKGIMQQIFPAKDQKTPKLRFPEFDGDWEEKRFKDIFSSIPTKKYQIKNIDFLKTGKFKVVDQGKKEIAGYSNNEDKLLKNTGVIIFGDHTTILKYIDFDFIVGADGTKILKNKNKNDDLKFLYYNLVINNVEQDGYKRHFSILKEKSLKIPQKPEQEKIALFLTSIDDIINSMETKITALENWKKGLMQKMFI